MILNDNQIKHIEKMIKNRATKKEIAEYLGVSEPTSRKILRNYSFDFSNYKRKSNREFIPTDAQLDFIKTNISKMDKQVIANKLEISRNTLAVVIKKYNIDITGYKRSGRKKELTNEEINKLKDMVENKIQYKDIAKVLNISKGLVPVLIERYNINTDKEYTVEEEYKNIICEMYNKGFSIRDIGHMTNKLKKSISQMLKDEGIEIHQHRRIEILEEEKLYYINEIIKIQNRYYSLNEEFCVDEINYIRENINKISVEEIAKNINRFNDEIIFIINKYKIGITDLSYGNIFNLPFGQDFEKDLCNPELTHTTVGRKYGISPTTIKKWRNVRYGDFKTRVNIWMNKTSIEIAMEKILDELDIIYQYQKEIDKYKFDYYLGRKCIIEMQGDYWHSIEKNIKSDINKKAFCDKNKYKILYVWENELKDIESVKSKVLKFVKENMKF